MPAPTASHASDFCDIPVLGETIGTNFDRTVAAYPEHDALVDCTVSRRWTYRRLAAEVNACALGLYARGIAKGDRVGLWSPNRAEWTIVQYATAKIGAILVPIDPAYTMTELRSVLQQADVRMLIAAPSYEGNDHRAAVAQMRHHCRNLQVVFLDGEEWDEMLWMGWCADPGLLNGIGATLSCDDPITIQYTSGTTGRPKGAVLSHHSVLNNAFFVAETQGWSPEDRVCLPVPFHHCFGMVLGNLAATSHGACVVIPAPGFDPGATLWAVQGERCTALYGMPAMFVAELNEPDFAAYDLSSLRAGVMAGAPCPVEVMKRVVENMGVHEVTIAYGMDESSPLCTQTHTTDGFERRVATVGTALPHTEVEIVDPGDRAHGPAKHFWRAVRARLLGDARLMERAGAERRGVLDAHRRPGDHA